MAQPEIDHVGMGKPAMLFGSNAAKWIAALIDALGHLQVDIVDAAGLQDALGSIATDLLRVESKSGDKIFGFESVLAELSLSNQSGNDGYIDSPSVDAGKIWVVSNVIARNTVRALTRMTFYNRHDNVNYDFYDKVAAFPTGERALFTGTLYMDVDDVIRVYFVGGLDGDACQLFLNGYVMNAP